MLQCHIILGPSSALYHTHCTEVALQRDVITYTVEFADLLITAAAAAVASTFAPLASEQRRGLAPTCSQLHSALPRPAAAAAACPINMSTHALHSSSHFVIGHCSSARSLTPY